jgi:hypothetical protein
MSDALDRARCALEDAVAAALEAGMNADDVRREVEYALAAYEEDA